MVTQSSLSTSPAKKLNRRFTVAPMMDWTDRHCRHFHRLLTQHAVLYTEMVTTGAIIHGDRARFLDFNKSEHPVALQLGGSKTDELARCSRYAQDWGYDEVNLNVGCPSDRVQNNMIGACLMAHPELVADCIKSMQDACDIPVTIKHRIGINGRESYTELSDFVGKVADTGCETFIVHARIAILEGLSPKQNRDIPPLQYDAVYKLKQDFPDLEIIINGGIKTLDECDTHLEHVDGIMMGREAYQNPGLLLDVDQRIYNDDRQTLTMEEAVYAMFPYIEEHLAAESEMKGKLNHITRHMLGLFQGYPGARKFRRYLSENAFKPEANTDTLLTALSLIEPKGL
jgi:tRNA-dihydrouridine synthase A